MPFICRICFLIASLAAGPLLADSITETRYSGSLSQTGADGDDLILRRFEAIVLQNGSDQFFNVLDDSRDGCPWPESYGRISGGGGPKPHLVYKYDERIHSHPLPPLTLELPPDMTSESIWTADEWSYEAVKKGTQNDKAIWKIQATNRRGRRQELTVSENGTLLDARQDVFMGQGEKFQLFVSQTTSNDIPAESVENVKKLQAELLSLQSELGQRPNNQQTALLPKQLKTTQTRLTSLTTLAKGTPLQEAVLRIRRDVDLQQQRAAQTMKRESQLLDKSAPEFSLNLVTRGTLESESLKGKVVVLHFWKYAEKPLAEPYGQVGYLEFLAGKRKPMNVRVVGIATNPALRQPDSVRSGKRTARKLVEFMNLSYPVGFDDGALLRELGDPRDAGGKLPLWVVISPNGKIVHYHSGYYEVDPRTGLKELDKVIVAEAKTASSN